MQVRLLGPVDLVRHGVARPVPGSRRQALLAVLALHCGEVVNAGRLIDMVWEEAARPAGNTLQTHLSYLRRALEVPIVSRATGYVLDLAEDGTDVVAAEPEVVPGSGPLDLEEAGTELLRRVVGARG